MSVPVPMPPAANAQVSVSSRNVVLVFQSQERLFSRAPRAPRPNVAGGPGNGSGGKASAR